MNNNRDRKSLVHTPTAWIIGIVIYTLSIVGSALLAIAVVNPNPPFKFPKSVEESYVINKGNTLDITLTLAHFNTCTKNNFR